MTDNPNDPHRVLKKRLAEAVAPIGLELRQYVSVVADEGDADHIQVVFTIDMDQLGKDAEQVEIDAQFADLAQSFSVQSLDDKEAEAIAGLQDLLSKGRKKPEADK